LILTIVGQIQQQCTTVTYSISNIPLMYTPL
jgi:hypothetical protein